MLVELQLVHEEPPFGLVRRDVDGNRPARGLDYPAVADAVRSQHCLNLHGQLSNFIQPSGDGRTGIELAGAIDGLDVVILDIGLPDMSGLDVARKAIILARELSLGEVKEIHEKNPGLELEYFVHGSICMAYSGRCLMSNYLTYRDAIDVARLIAEGGIHEQGTPDQVRAEVS